jgi:hypothetical protein
LKVQKPKKEGGAAESKCFGEADVSFNDQSEARSKDRALKRGIIWGGEKIEGASAVKPLRPLSIEPRSF